MLLVIPLHSPRRDRDVTNPYSHGESVNSSYASLVASQRGICISSYIHSISLKRPWSASASGPAIIATSQGPLTRGICMAPPYVATGGRERWRPPARSTPPRRFLEKASTTRGGCDGSRSHVALFEGGRVGLGVFAGKASTSAAIALDPRARLRTSRLLP